MFNRIGRAALAIGLGGAVALAASYFGALAGSYFAAPDVPEGPERALEAPSGLPRLIGLDCEGATGPLYANAESDFPACRDIVPVYGRTVWRAVVEWESGESDIMERGALGDCMAALARFDRHKPAVVTYCERESSYEKESD